MNPICDHEDIAEAENIHLLSSTSHMTTVSLFSSLRENYQKLSEFSNIRVSQPYSKNHIDYFA